MTSLTTRQRDILKILLKVDQPIGTGEIANSVQLSARQVNYSMKGIDHWLKSRDASLNTKPGVGTVINCPPNQKAKIIQELEGSSRLQLVLTPEQRQQLIYFYLLFETHPVILTQLAQMAKVSRTTILTDLDLIEEWISNQNILLERKQNYGVWIQSTEKDRQQAILNFLWGGYPSGQSMFSISFQKGMVFSLDEDAHFLPLVEKINHILHLINLKKIFNKVVLVEDFLVGRFTDDAVLFLALVLSILEVRVGQGQHMETPASIVNQLKSLPVWEAASRLVDSREEDQPNTWQDEDIAYLAMYINASPRVESWPGDMEQETLYRELSDELLAEVGKFYQLEDLQNDPTLRDGLVNHLIPVCNQQVFDLWFPKTHSGLSREAKYSKEYDLASSLIKIIQKHIEVELPEEEINMIAALLRAAYIRLRPHHFKQVLVICPAGMATAQLLIARLSTRFPRLGKLTVISFRELNQEKIDQADLIITLMPIPEEMVQDKPVIQVSPQLFPEDVEAITSFLT